MGTLDFYSLSDAVIFKSLIYIGIFKVFPCAFFCEHGNTSDEISVPMKKRFSASQIAEMHLPGLPTTKARVIARATNEGWLFEEVKGLGGMRRMYEVPERYMPTPEGSRVEQPSTEHGVERKVAGTIVAGSAQVDPQKLELAIRALGEWEIERGLKVSDERRPAVIAVLYDYLQKAEGEGAEAMALMLRALG